MADSGNNHLATNGDDDVDDDNNGDNVYDVDDMSGDLGDDPDDGVVVQVRSMSVTSLWFGKKTLSST